MHLPNLIKASLGLCAFAVMNYAAAENVGFVSASGTEKTKFSNCGSTIGDYVYSFFVHEDGTWDYYDVAQNVTVPAAGTYTGTPDSRKMNLVAGLDLTNTFVYVIQDFAGYLCGTPIDVVSYRSLIYKVKINKNRTTAKVTGKLDVRGYSPYYGRYGTSNYRFNGSGSYSIESM